VVHVLCVLPPSQIGRGVYMDPPTAAVFTIERVVQLSPGELHALANVLAPGLCVVVRNDGAAARRFRAQIETCPDLDAVEDQLTHVVERDWAAAYDRAMRARRNGKEPAR
jgi:hypothetical protein